MTRKNAIKYVVHHVDDALSPDPKPITEKTRLIGWQCGFGPLFIAVHSCLPDCSCDGEEAAELATDYLEEVGWFSGGPTEPDFLF